MAIALSSSLVAEWAESVSPVQADSAALFWWIDETAAMQMVQGLSRQFVARQSRKFLAAVVNVELFERRSGHCLFGVICCDDDGALNANKYRFKMKALMTAQQILAKFGIHSHDLPRPSRAEPALLEQLALKRPIAPRDIDSVQWANLKVVGRTQTHFDHHHHDQPHPPPPSAPPTTVPIAHSVMDRYGRIAAERVQNGGAVQME